ncbi:MAG: 16S rRNA (guanine(527)-N(7))-methyltransferase RsmG [Bacteroidota bacterium]|nr:16S rRNA (guanine(527)-N(7))-methyltransferase RsmG [Bacteroidota bacterium]
MATDTILHYFPELSSHQQRQLQQLRELFTEWNNKINLVSRKDIENLEIHHFLYSLAIARHFPFKEGCTVLDAGTGGGLPGLPLAIYFPEVRFILADSIGKKIRAVQSMAESLDLKNVTAICTRVEQLDGPYDFITGRAVTSLPEMAKILKGKISSKNLNPFPNGLLYLKGGDFSEEAAKLTASFKIYELHDLFSESFFDTKKLIYIYGDELLKK